MYPYAFIGPPNDAIEVPHGNSQFHAYRPLLPEMKLNVTVSYFPLSVWLSPGTRGNGTLTKKAGSVPGAPRTVNVWPTLFGLIDVTALPLIVAVPPTVPRTVSNHGSLSEPPESYWRMVTV